MKNIWNNNTFNLNSKFVFKSLKTRGRSIRDIITEIQSYKDEEDWEDDNYSSLENKEYRANKYRP